ncbi:J domain-containing protein [Stomatohabitans albus]|uniref:J domain-containing protein n=1 Tax=Stomatohabitans albus TaxID=3110766 RepID=UPI00300D0ECF
MAADLYAILGVSQDATEEELKKAYRKKSRELHPDTGGDEDAFKELQAAYEVLKNPQARANYDQYGDPRGPMGGMGGMGGDPFAGAGMGDINDLISMLFGAQPGMGGRGRRGPVNEGRDAIVDTVISLEEAFRGVERKVDVRLGRTCDVCEGTGSESKQDPVTCPTCDGSGVVQQVRNSLFGQMMTQGICPTCRGDGAVISDPCPVCDGEGRVVKDEQIKVRIPAGIASGQRLRVEGRGESGRRGAANGDLYVRVGVSGHNTFQREGDDLHMELRIGMIPAALGSTTDVTMLDGEQVPVEIPAGTQFGRELVVKGKGMPRFGSSERGDLHVHCLIETPRDLSPEDREALEGIAKRRGEDVNPAKHVTRGFFDRIKDAFTGD